MKRSWIWMLPLVCSFAVAAQEWKPCSDFLKAVSFVESSHGRYTIGDGGRSLGVFQLSEAAWLDVNDWRRARGFKTYTYRANVHNAFINKVYASNYLTILHTELSKKLNRAPDHSELYAAYNMGMAMFAKCRYQLGRVNSVTRSKCRLITEMMSTPTQLAMNTAARSLQVVATQ